MVTLTPSASATDGLSTGDATVTAALLEGVGEGGGTAAEMEAVRKNPEPARIVPDPNRTETGVEEAGSGV